MPAKTRQPANLKTPGVRVALLRAEGSAADRPKELVMLSWGRNETREGLFIVNERTVACLRANQELIGRPRVMGDFEHASVDEDPANHPMHFGSEGRPDASRENGLRIVDVEWKPAGVEHVPVNYPDLSVAPIYDEKTREVIGVHSYAHCRHGAADVATYENSLRPALAALNARLAVLSDNFTRSTKKPEPAKPMPENESLCALLNKLGFPCDASSATPESLTTLAEQALAKLDTLLAKPSDEKPSDEKPSGEVAALSLKVDGLLGKLATLTSEIETGRKLRKFEDMLNEGLNEGRVIGLSANDLMLLGEARAKEVIAASPAGVVPMDRRTPVVAKLNASPLAAQPNAEEAQALKDLGVTLPADKKA